MKNLNNYIKICMRELDDLSINYSKSVRFEINRRAKSRYGMCKKENDGFVISVSDMLLMDEVDEKSLKDTIIHELLHTCKDCQNHGAQWKKLAQAVNEKYGYNIKRASSRTEKGLPEIKERDAKYAVCCTVCGKVFERYRMSKLIRYPNMYCCGVCRGKLKRIK